MEFRNIIFSGLLGAAFVLSGNGLTAQEKKVVKVGEYKPLKVTVKAQEPADAQKQTKLFEKAAKLSAKASELAAAGKHQEAAEMARKAAELLTAKYEVNVVKPKGDYSKSKQKYVRPQGSTDAWFNEAPVDRNHQYFEAQEQHQKAMEQAKRAQEEARRAFEDAMKEHGNHQLELQDFHEHLNELEVHGLHEHMELLHEHMGDLGATIDLSGLKVLDLAEVQGLQELQELELLHELQNLELQDREDVQIFRFQGHPEGEWQQKQPDTFFWQSDDGEMQGQMRFEFHVEGDFPQGIRGHAPLVLQGGNARGLALPGAIGKGEYRVLLQGECESECEAACECECESDYTTDRNVEYKLKYSTAPGVEYIPDCESGATYDVETKKFYTPEGEKEVKIRLAPRAKGQALPGMRVYPAKPAKPAAPLAFPSKPAKPAKPAPPAKPAKPAKLEAQQLINEMQSELEALRKEIAELRRTMGNDPLVMRYRAERGDAAVAQAVPVSTKQ